MRLAARLPAHSRYVAALMDDPVAAAYLAEQDDTSHELTMAGFDPLRALLSAVLDAVNAQTAVLVAANSENGTLPDWTPAPRPVTEVDRARRRLREQSRKALVALALGKSIDEI